MYRSSLKTKTLLSKIMAKKAGERNYAAFGGKSKIGKDQELFNQETKKNVIHNGHVQYITDFNIIYADPAKIKLYQIATLYTHKTKNSYETTKDENYMGQKSKQNIEFFPKPIEIKHDIHYIRKSREYLNKPEVREKIENSNEYKDMFDAVIKELKAQQIEYRVAETIEEQELTGLNILEKKSDKELNTQTALRSIMKITDET